MVSLVLWLAFAIVDGGPSVMAFPTQEVCEEAVSHGRNNDFAVSDCVKVELPAPRTLPKEVNTYNQGFHAAP